MQTRKFWCHYFASNGNDTRRRKIELTKLDWFKPFDNSNRENPVWYEKDEEDNYYDIYVQLTDDTAVFIRSIYGEELHDWNMDVNDLEHYCLSRLELYKKWNPNLTQDKYDQQLAWIKEEALDEIKKRVSFLSEISSYTNYVLWRKPWVSNVDIAALTDIASPLLEKAMQRRSELMAERQREEEERRKEEERLREEQLKQEEKERIEEERRLLIEEQKFMGGGFITGCDLVEICRKYDIKIHLRTVHNLQQHVYRINGSGQLNYCNVRSKRKPSFDGCFDTAERLYKYLNSK